MLKLIIDHSRYAEEKIINQVLRAVLKRDITPLDWEDCEMVAKVGDLHSYFFTHKGIRLGIISKEIKETDYNFTLSIVFTPVSDLN